MFFWEKAFINYSRTRKTASLFKVQEVKWTPKSMNSGKNALKAEKTYLVYILPETYRQKSAKCAHCSGGKCCNLLCDVRLAAWCPAIAVPLSAGGVKEVPEQKNGD